MRVKLFFFLVFGVLVSCTKDKIPQQPEPKEEQWEKFLGKYKVYDTTGVYLYNSEIEYFSKINSSGFPTPNIRIRNLLNMFDYEFLFSHNINENILDLRIKDSIKDYQGNTWSLSTLKDDSNTFIIENSLIEDEITFFFRITNIKYWMNESVPYVYENVKHVYVKQP